MLVESHLKNNYEIDRPSIDISRAELLTQELRQSIGRCNNLNKELLKVILFKIA